MAVQARISSFSYLVLHCFSRGEQKSNTPEQHFELKCLHRLQKSSIQDWGEEVEEGAVYHVTLKRVQIQQAANKGARWLGQIFNEAE
uniref:Uncharacterized protein n=1 Tax=Chrysolophus pictus TaxID=9089 RepID=A0A8C3LJ61_CHRPC